MINIIINISLNHFQEKALLNSINTNTYGLKFNNNCFFHNIYGFDINSSLNPSIQNLSSQPLVYIYNTYQTDKYQNNYYSTYTINPVITSANLIFREYLKNNNIPALIETKSVAKILKENNLDYSLSYRASRILLEAAQNNYRSLQYFFDLGMSDYNKERTTININNINYAKIIFIIGTDNPNYKENLIFAESLKAKFPLDIVTLEKRGGNGYHGIYNEDFNAYTLLIYIGGHENTIDEVTRSLELLAKALYKYIKE